MLFELIETLWNVNLGQDVAIFEVITRINRNIVECKYRHYFSTVTRDAELIETLWNVNDISVIKLVTSRRINRNIVECKSKYCSDSFCKQIELIETLWNVNKFTNVKFDSNS